MIDRKYAVQAGSAEVGSGTGTFEGLYVQGQEMKTNLRRWGALGATAISMAGAMVVMGGATAAHADTRCSASAILINDSPGGDHMQLAWGHSHRTGNHFVSGSTWDGAAGKYKWYWFADNDGGSDGDTGDTFYGYSWCNTSAPPPPESV
ncbi:hypothetical protein ACIA8R_33590 [Nonomuraea sp. NPDC051191]|uniref:hypothetical protein n=1 Tax=Nonomuraea sp. NPDC051191 TaxID=3364372 RepID=UPI003792ECAC